MADVLGLRGKGRGGLGTREEAMVYVSTPLRP